MDQPPAIVPRATGGSGISGDRQTAIVLGKRCGDGVGISTDYPSGAGGHGSGVTRWPGSLEGQVRKERLFRKVSLGALGVPWDAEVEDDRNGDEPDAAAQAL